MPEKYGQLLIDPRQGDKAVLPALHSRLFWAFPPRRPHMRAFHFAWFSFFVAFLSWFSFAPLMGAVQTTLGLSDAEVWDSHIACVSLSLFLPLPLPLTPLLLAPPPPLAPLLLAPPPPFLHLLPHAPTPPV